MDIHEETKIDNKQDQHCNVPEIKDGTKDHN